MAAPARVLVVEDDVALRDGISAALRGGGYEVRAEADGREIARVAEQFRPDLGVLDVRLPAGPDGFVLGAELRRSAGIPILFLTAADGLEDRLRGFEVGADDYLVKPFALAEFLARVRAVLRRSGRLSSPSREVRDLVVDEAHRVALRGGVLLELTNTEFELLCAFARSPGTVFSKAQLLSLVWGFDEYDVNLVEVHVSALRRKMDALGPRLIHTVRGAGYVLGP
jgi:DNA-binding response OmpR family regulator